MNTNTQSYIGYNIQYYIFKRKLEYITLYYINGESADDVNRHGKAGVQNPLHLVQIDFNATTRVHIIIVDLALSRFYTTQ